jgi:hypothetical protein
MNPSDLDPSMQRDRISALLRESGARPTLDEDRKARMRAAVEQEWQAAFRQRRSRVRWTAVAATAVAALIGLTVFKVTRAPGPVNAAATIRVAGPVSLVRDTQSIGTPLTAGIQLEVGAEITTRSGGRALARIGQSVLARLDEQSSVRIVSRDALLLRYGAVYIEIPERNGVSQTLQLVTPFGKVRHIGTRFEVRVADDALMLRVRDGMATFESPSDTPRPVTRGQELVMRAGHVTVRPGPSAVDDVWSWTHSISPPFSIEGRSLDEALGWLAREGGFDVMYADESVRATAREVILHGSIDGFTVREAFVIVLAGSGLHGRIEGDKVYVSFQKDLQPSASLRDTVAP